MAENGPEREPDNESLGILYGDPEAVWRWHIQYTGQEYEGIRSIVAAIGITKGDKLIGSVIYSRYRPPDIELHIHTVDRRWCNRRTLRAIFSFPFLQLGCGRCTAITDPANPAVVNLLERIGFVREGIQRKASTRHTDLYAMGMLREECKWIK